MKIKKITTYGILKLSPEFMDALGVHNEEEYALWQALLRFGFPADTRVVRGYQEIKDIPSGIYSALISQKDLPPVGENCMPPIVKATFSRDEAGIISFSDWQL